MFKCFQRVAVNYVVMQIPISTKRIDDNTIRRLLMVLLAFLMTHLITYQKLPFTADYKFPIIPFSIFIIYGILICETNTWNYKRFISKFGSRFDLKGILRIIRTNLIACTIIFIVLTAFQMAVFQFIMDPFRFVGLLSICLMISLIETGVFIVLTFSKNKKPLTLNRVAAQTEGLTILRNDELLTFKEEEVEVLVNQNGCIFLYDSNGNRFTTQFESLNEVESKLSENFFRANRQTLISKSAIKSLQKDSNKKLKLELHQLDQSITVSRYKSRDLKNWFKS